MTLMIVINSYNCVSAKYTQAVDMDNLSYSQFGGVKAQKEYSLFGFEHSLKWDMNVNSVEAKFDYYQRQDWSRFDALEIYVHSQKAGESRFYLYIDSNKYTGGSSYLRQTVKVNWDGWGVMHIPFSKMTKTESFDLSAVTGLRLVPRVIKNYAVPNDVLSFASFRLVDYDEYDYFAELYDSKIYSRTAAELGCGIMVRNGADFWLVNGKANKFGQNGEKAIYENETVWIPYSALKSVELDKRYYKFKTLKSVENVKYVSLSEIARFKRMNIVVTDEMAVLGGEGIEIFKSPSVYSDCAIQMMYYKDPDDITLNDTDFLRCEENLKNIYGVDARTLLNIEKYSVLSNQEEPFDDSDFVEWASANIAKGIVEKNSKLLFEMRDRISSKFANADYGKDFEKLDTFVKNNIQHAPGQGIWSDGSFISDGAHPSNGNSGIDRLSVVKAASLLAGTSFEVNDYTKEQIYNYIVNGCVAFISNGKVMRMVTAEDDSFLYEKAAQMLDGMVHSITVLNENMSADIKKYICEIAADIPFEHMSSLNSSTTKTINEIISENIVVAGREYSKVYTAIDKVVSKNKNYTLGLSMSSGRIFNYSTLKGNNLEGWYLGDGMLNIAVPDDEYSYSDDYWKKVNPYKLPGTTVLNDIRTSASIKNGLEYLSPNNYAGGVATEKITVGAMELMSESNENIVGSGEVGEATTEGASPVRTVDLRAKKSWFMFDDVVVALGSGISDSTGNTALTVVDNRNSELKLNRNNNGIVETAYFSSGYGYYFPEEQTVISNKTDNGFNELWIEHGGNSQNGVYNYIILPNVTEKELSEFKDNPHIRIVSNNDTVQAVEYRENGILGYVFYEGGTKNGITVSAPMIVVTEDMGESLKLYVSDPTQTLKTETIMLDGVFNKCIGDVNILCPDKNHTLLTVDFSDSKGKTFIAELKK